MTGHVFAFVTGERHTPESLAFGDAAERGWIDPSWSMTVFHDSRNDVRPVVDCSVNDPDLADYCREAIDSIGTVVYVERGTFYGADSVTWDYTTADTFTYAVHFVVKDYDGTRGWHETDFDPMARFCLEVANVYGGACHLAPGHDGAHVAVND